MVKTCFYLGLLLGVVSCATPPVTTDDLVRAWREKGVPGGLEVSYPIDGAVFPLELGPFELRWVDRSQQADTWLVHVGTSGEETLASSLVAINSWIPGQDQWKQITRAGVQGPVTITILGSQKADLSQLVTGATITIRASDDPVDSPIFFREVPLPFDYANKYPEKIRYRLGHVNPALGNRVLLENLPLCGNCHSFSKDGQILGMDVDYANDKGSYVVTELQETTRLVPNKIMTWSDFRPEDKTLTFGLLSQVSPDGRHVVSTVKDRSIFVGIEENLAYSQLFFPIKGVLVVYNRETKQFTRLNGADDPAFVQSNPAWSPDGKTLFFARAKAYHSKKAEASTGAVLPREAASEFLKGKRGFQYDIYSVPFNNGAGGDASSLLGASNNGMSNYFPKVSPDGRWVVFVQAQNFMLLQPDSKLYIVPATGGEAREMRCNTDNMNSWHSFSPNGRWMVFSSKANGAYTQLWLTHLNEDGTDSPPVLLSHLTSDKRAANIPEFWNNRNRELEKLEDHFSQGGNYHYRVAKNLIRYGELKDALLALHISVANQPNNPDVFLERGALQYRMGDVKAAFSDFEYAAKLAPDDYRVPFNTAVVKEGQGNINGALGDLDRAISLNPINYDLWGKRASVKLKMRDFSGALSDLDKAVAINASSAELLNLRGDLKRKLKDYEGAQQDFSKAIQLKPGFGEAHLNRSYTYLSTGHLVEAESSLNKARKHIPNASLGYLIEVLLSIKKRNIAQACRVIRHALEKNATKGHLADFKKLQAMCR